MVVGEEALPNALMKVSRFDEVMQAVKVPASTSHKRLLIKKQQDGVGLATAFRAIAGDNGRTWENLSPRKLHAPWRQ